MVTLPPEKPLSPEEQDERYLHLVPEIEAAFSEGYSDDLIYHVWDHGLVTHEANAALREGLRSREVANVPGHFMTHIDSKGHDYNYLQYFELKKAGKMKLKQPEAFAIHSGSEILREFGVDEFTIQEFGHNVWGTRLGTRCSTVGQFTICAADLANTAADYETVFREDTRKLLIEKMKIDNCEVDELQFMSGALAVLARYRYVNLGSVVRRRESPELMAFYKAQGANLKALGFELARCLGMQSVEEINERLAQIDEFVAKLCPFKPRRSSR